MGLWRAILSAIIIYLIFNTVRNVFKFLAAAKPANNPNEIKKSKQSRYRIENEDVIDAHFEEIDSSKSEKQKENF